MTVIITWTPRSNSILMRAEEIAGNEERKWIISCPIWNPGTLGDAFRTCLRYYSEQFQKNNSALSLK